jgi:hypothetical protein
MTAKLRQWLPFLLDTDAAVTLMTQAIERRARTYSFPWQMRLLRLVMLHAPEWLVTRVAAAARTSD